MRALIILCLLLQPTTIPKWREASSTKAVIFYVADARTEREDSGVVRVWEKHVPRDTPEGRERRAELVKYLTGRGVERERAERYDHSEAFNLYDCPRGRQGFLTFRYVAANGAIIYEETKEATKATYSSPTPGSAVEKMMLDLCKREPVVY